MSEPLEAFLARIPDPNEVRRRIAENLNERQLLRHVLKLAEQREKVHEVRPGCQQRPAAKSPQGQGSAQ